MKIELAIRKAHRSERDLAKMLTSVTERHKVEHEVYHVALGQSAQVARDAELLTLTKRRHPQTIRQA